MPAKKKVTKPSRNSNASSLGPLIKQVRSLVQFTRRTAAASVNTLQVLTNFEIGRRIVEHEQKGAKRAEYGAELLQVLSARLTAEFGRGFSEDNLSNMRRFFLAWKDRIAEFPRRLLGNPVQEIPQKPSVELLSAEIGQETAGQSTISRKASGELVPLGISQKPSAASAMISANSSRKSPFPLSWSHYVLLLGIKDADERSFYEIEAAAALCHIPPA